MDEKPNLLSRIVELFGLVTAASFVCSCLVNAAVFDAAWGISYFIVASPQDVLMNGVMILSIVLVIALVAFSLVNAIYYAMNAFPRWLSVMKTVEWKRGGFPDLKEYKYRPNMTAINYKKFMEISSFTGSVKILFNPFWVTLSLIAIFVLAAVVSVRFGSIYYYTTEQAIRRDVSTGVIPRSLLPRLPIGNWPKSSKLTSDEVHFLRVRGYHYNQKEQFSYGTGLRISEKSRDVGDCAGAPILWMGASSAVVACKDRIQVFHKLDSIISEPAG